MSRTTAERILDAAEDHFARRGFDACSLSQIADDVGIRPPGLYNHFKSKAHLYQAVLERLFDPFFEMLDDFVEPPHNTERTEKVLELMMLHHAEHPNLARLMQHASLAGGEPLEMLATGWYLPFFDRIRRRVSESEELHPVPPEFVPVVVLGLINIVTGFMTLAPLHSRVLGFDTTEPRMLQAQIHYLKHLARDLEKLEGLGR